MLGILIGAAILGGIISIMQQGEFPGWGAMIICVLAALVPAFVINQFLVPPKFFIVGLAVGAVCAGFAISATVGMDVKRSIIAASIYLAIQFAISLIFLLMMH